MYGLPPDQQTDENQALADPLGDLLLSVAAILMLAIILILPLSAHLPSRTIEQAPSSEAASSEDIAAKQVDELWRLREPIILLANKDGLRFGAAPLDYISVDGILNEQSLSNKYRDLEPSDRSTILFIEPDGFESAFLFEAIARHFIGVKITQIRLRRRCDALRSFKLKRLCSFGASNVRE